MEAKRIFRVPRLGKRTIPPVVFAALFICSSVWADYEVADGPLMTRWSKHVSPDRAHREYPRPQMVRKSWLNLNGLWDYAIEPKDEPRPSSFAVLSKASPSASSSVVPSL